MNAPSTPPPPAMPRPATNLLSGRALLLAGCALVALLVGVVAALVSYQMAHEVDEALERHAMLARVIEAHAARTIDLAAQAARDVAEAVGRGADPEGAAVADLLLHTLADGGPLSALAVVEPDGRVVAAAGTASAGTMVDWTRLPPPPQPGRAALLGIQPGRGLPLQDSAELAPDGLTVLPYARSVALGDGRVLHVVVLLNPQALATFQEQALDDPRRAAALVGFEGRVVAATASAGLRADRALADLPPLTSHLPQTRHATWVGDGLRPGTRMAAFHALREHPMWVIVDMDRAEVTAEVAERVRGFVAAAAAAALALLALTLVAGRVQRARESDRLALDRAQAALAARGRELDAIFASVRELLFRTDATGAVELINERWVLASGLTAHDAVGQPFAGLVCAESREAVAALFEVEPVREARQATAAIVGPQGRLSRFELTVVPLVEQGRLTGFAGCGVDVTELLAAQTQLRAQLAFNTALVESHPLPVAVRDTLNRYVRVNRAWETFFGRSRDRVIGTLASLTHGPELARVHDQKARELLARGGGEVRYEAQALRADGQLRDVLSSMALIPGADGQPAGIVAVFMDVSELREAERATRLARDAAESASGAKSEFIASISHELRTPLQSILGFSEIGQQRPDAGALFGDIHRAGERMLALVDDLLDLSRLERPAATPQAASQDIRALVRDVAGEVEPLARRRSVALQLQLPATPLVAHVDGARLAQVIRNLLANAIRLSPPTQAVEIAAANRSDGTVELRVSDRGPGIPPDELERIFEPFVQSSRTKGASGGTGLGLAISRRIVQAHGGRLAAANRDGGGAVFSVELQAAHIGEAQPAKRV